MRVIEDTLSLQMPNLFLIGYFEKKNSINTFKTYV